MTFEFATAGRIVFGSGSVQRLPEWCAGFGKRALVVTGAQPERHAKLLTQLEAAGLHGGTWAIQHEPTTHDIRRGAAMARENEVDMVIGLGGGSVMDAAKAIAAMARQPGDLFDYLEVVGRAQPLDATPLPILAVPTTAGTGAEVTRNAVLASPEHGVKASLRHVAMLPSVALVDPELALDCPAAVTAASGMDALTQCLEAYVSSRAQPLTDALCLDGIRRAVRSLEIAVNDGANLAAREDLALAALFSGLALANAGLGAVHGFAAPLGGQFHAPHGAVCAALLAPVWEANVRRLRADGISLERFQIVASLLTPDGDLEAAGAFLKDLRQRLAIPGLAAHGIAVSDFDELAQKAAKASSMKGNPVVLRHEELTAILHAAL